MAWEATQDVNWGRTIEWGSLSAKENTVRVRLCTLGAVLLVVGMGLFLFLPDQEVSMWYAATLCPTEDVKSSRLWVGSNIDTDGVCPTSDVLPQSVSFKVSPSLFRDRLGYWVAVYRTDGAAVRLAFSVIDSTTGTTLVNQTAIVLPTVSDRSGVVVVGTTGGGTTESGSTTTSSVRRGRRLLKGGGYLQGDGEGAARARSGRGMRYPYSDPLPTDYGFTGPYAINEGTVVQMYRKGPQVVETDDGRAYSRGGEIYTPGCTDIATGCSYGVGDHMTRDEFSQLRVFTVTPTAPSDVILRVEDLAVYSPTANMPNIFFTFYTRERPGAGTAAYVLMLLAPVILCCCIPAMRVIETWRVDASAHHNGHDYEDEGEFYTFDDKQPLAARTSPTALPPPVEPDVAVDLSNGSEVSTAFAFSGEKGHVTYVNLYANEVKKIEGLSAWPSLVRLNLKFNNIESLRGIADARSLTALDVSDNDLVSADELGELNLLTELNIANNGIEHMDFLLPSLRWLNAQHNCFTRVPHVTLTPTLKWVDLSNNRLRSVRGLERCTALQSLNVADNYLQSEEELVRIATDCERLLYLNVYGNDLAAGVTERLDSVASDLVVIG